MSNGCTHMTDKGCAVIDDMCEGLKCRFFETKEQHIQKQEETFGRLMTLPREQQMAIAQKYYAGQMPWQKMR